MRTVRCRDVSRVKEIRGLLHADGLSGVYTQVVLQGHGRGILQDCNLFRLYRGFALLLGAAQPRKTLQHWFHCPRGPSTQIVRVLGPNHHDLHGLWYLEPKYVGPRSLGLATVWVVSGRIPCSGSVSGAT